VEEEHVQEELLLAHMQRNLAPEEREAGTQLDHEALDLGNERALDARLPASCARPRNSKL
jgi:hypothetical protein